MKAAEIIAVLRGANDGVAQQRGKRDTVLWFEELRLGAGYGGISERRIDLLRIETAPGKGHRTTVYEVKVSRSDLLKELKDPKKQRGARLFADYFWYATPPGLTRVEEIPLWAGLLEIHPEEEGWWKRAKMIVPAPRLDKQPPTWGLTIAMARNARRGVEK